MNWGCLVRAGVRDMAIVVTTVSSPSPSLVNLGGRVNRGLKLLVVGDSRTPPGWWCEGAHFWSYEAQGRLPFRLAMELPINTYCRKMLGYLLAAQLGVGWIRETDDDNDPYPAFLDPPPFDLVARCPIMEPGSWLNPFPFFGVHGLWPRGFPLERIRDKPSISKIDSQVRLKLESCIVQSLADGDPDVDAVARLVGLTQEPIRFEDSGALRLPSGCWTPVNSQVTTWPSWLLPLMYLPVSCSMRMTDIWRGFVAQRICREIGVDIVIVGPTVRQRRNVHDLLDDFALEYEGYMGYRHFVGVLNEIQLDYPSDLLGSLQHCYQSLVEQGFFDQAELIVLSAWSKDVATLMSSRRSLD